MSGISAREANGTAAGAVPDSTRPGSTGPDSTGPNGAGSFEALLDAICRNAARLLGVSAASPARLRIEVAGTSVELEWPQAGAHATAPAAAPPAARAPSAEAGWPGAADGAADGFAITATTVGTFYHCPGPGEPPFVQPGDLVEPGQQVGILEVMKLMTPVTAQQPGQVTQVLVADGSPVEYGQPLIACAHASTP